MANIGPPTITLTNTQSTLDYTDRLQNVVDYRTPRDTIWEKDGRYYDVTELCRGIYKGK